MNDKYKLLQANPSVCKRLFGIDFVLLEQVLKKVQARIDQHLQENPLSKRGIDAELSVANQLLLTFEYLRQFPVSGCFVRNVAPGVHLVDAHVPQIAFHFNFRMNSQGRFLENTDVRLASFQFDPAMLDHIILLIDN